MLELHHRSITDLSRAVRAKELTCADVLEAFLRRIEQKNPKINAIVTLDAEGARSRAHAADAALARGEDWGPLHGMPVTFKDMFETAGMRTTAAFEPLANHIPKVDAPVVEKMRSAGAIVLGKTNMPRLCGDSQAISQMFGMTRNPWHDDFTPGGTSGGDGAAVAAGFSALSVGGDLGGSVRVPAHYCGVYSFKPTEGRVSCRGMIPPLPGSVITARHMASLGPMARCVADLRLWLTTVAGPHPADPDLPPVPIDQAASRSVRGLRIAWTDDFGGATISSETRQMLSALASTLEQAGATVVRANPPGFDFETAWRVYYELYGAFVLGAFPASQRFLFSLLRPFVSDRHYRMVLGRTRTSAGQYFALRMLRERIIIELDRFLSEYDAWICPVSADAAFPHRRPNRPDLPILVDGQKVSGVHGTMAHTLLFNLTGNPVVGMPITTTRRGLPLSVQVVGQRWRDMELFGTAEAIETVTGPYRPPPE